MEYNFPTTVTDSGNSDAFDMNGHGQISFTANITAISGSGTNIQLTIEASDDGSNWNGVHDTRRFTTTGAQRISGVRISSKFFRYKWIVNGSTPSITFVVTTTLKSYSPIRTGSQFKYDDLDLKTINAVSTSYSAFANTEVSCMIVRPNDALVQTALLRIQVSNDGLSWGDFSGDLLLPNDTTIVRGMSGNSYRFFRVKVIAPVILLGASTAHVLWNSTGGS